MDESKSAPIPNHRHKEFVRLLTASHVKLLGYLFHGLGKHSSQLHFNGNLLTLIAVELLEDLKHQERCLAAMETCFVFPRLEDHRLLRASCSGHGGISTLAAQMGHAPRTLYNKLAFSAAYRRIA